MKWLLALFLSTALLLGTVAPVQSASAAEEPPTKLLRITKYQKNINKPCPKGSDKMFTLRVFVHDDSLGHFADGNRGRATLVLKNGKKLRADDYVVGPDDREVNYFFFAPKRGSRVDKSVKHRVRVQLSGPNMWFRMGKLTRQCQERFEG